MNNPNNIQSYPQNPNTRRRHLRQSRWQILFPVLLGSVLIILLAFLVATASTSQVIRFSDISMVFLILPTALIGFIFLLGFCAMIYGLARLIGLIPHYAAWTQNFIEQVTQSIKDLADKAAQPVVKVDSVWAGVKTIFNRGSDLSQ